MKIVYIAGPYRAKTAWEIEKNIQRARFRGAEVAAMGAMPIIPHTNTAHFDGIQDDLFWIDGTLELMRRCDAVLLCGQWLASVGTMGEIEEAKRLGIPVFRSTKGLTDWLRGDQ